MMKSIYEHLQENNLYPEQQKGNVKGSFGCKDHLILSKILIEDCKRNKKNVSIGWIDYRKAYDSVPHSWLIEILKIYKVHDNIIMFIKNAMKNWKTNLWLNTLSDTINYGEVNIKCGIFQGDALSPLLFCMALFPLSELLSKSGTGYQIKKNDEKLHHLLFVDDLKLIANSDIELLEQIHLVTKFSEDINMKFGIDKCAKITIRKGRMITTSNIKLDNSEEIKQLEGGESYKYLGFQEANGIKEEDEKKKYVAEYYRRVRKVARSELTAKNKFTAIGSLAIPVLLYTFGVISWKTSEIKRIDRKTRKILTMEGLHHPRADVDRLYTPRRKGGRGLIQVEAMYKLMVVAIDIYLNNSNSSKLLLQAAREDSNKPTTKSIHKKAQIFINELELVTNQDNQSLSKERIKETLRKGFEKRWAEKPMHGQFYNTTAQQWVNKQQSYSWLCRSHLKGETEAAIIAIQDQAVSTKYIQKRITKVIDEDKCRLCKEQPETIHHLISGCSVLAKREYILRHDKICSRLHYNICRFYDIECTEKWYEHQPRNVEDNPRVTILWNTQVHTDRHIAANKPDIVIKDKEDKKCLIIDVSVPLDNNVNLKFAEKKLKYKDLEIEVARLWNLKTKIIPIIIGATGVLSVEAEKVLKELPGCQQAGLIAQLQDSVIMGTCYIIRKIL